MRHEGSVNDLLQALKETNELMGKGTINGKLKCKTLFEFNEEIYKHLIPIKQSITEMQKLINSGIDHSTGYFRYGNELFDSIEATRMQILARVYALSVSYSIPVTFGPYAFEAYEQ
jgi:hypothetical protein